MKACFGRGAALVGLAVLTAVVPVGAWSAGAVANGLILLTGVGQISTVEATGKGSKVLPLPQGESNGNQPAWSPSASKITFYTTNNSGARLWVMNADGSKPTPVTAIGAFTGIDHPTWSPGGTTIAFGGTANINPSSDSSCIPSLSGSSISSSGDRCPPSISGPDLIWSVSADGQRLHALTNVTATPAASGPTWSPDGKELAFVASDGVDAKGNPPSGIYIMKANGTGVHRLTPPSANTEHDPAWSPDGTWLAFASIDANWQTTHVANIETVRTSGTDVRQLTTGGYWAGSPVVSPDGKKIIFYRYQGTQVDPHVFIMNSDGTGTHELLAAEATPFSWAKAPTRKARR